MPAEPLKDAFSSDESFNDEEESESDSDVDAKLAEDDVFDVEFLKCYSALKKKDEKIYDENVRFFNDKESSSSSETDVKNEAGPKVSNIKKSKPPKLTLLDLQLQSNEEAEDLDATNQPNLDPNKEGSKSYYEKELEDIKNSIRKVNEDLDDTGDDLLVLKGSDEDAIETKKSKIDSLLDRIVDQESEDLNNLKEIWSNPENLSKEDKYLRDYILNKRYLPTNVNVEDNGKQGFFSTNLDDLSDVNASEEEPEVERGQTTRHSDEKDFDKLTRVPRNSTKTIRDMVEKREKRERRAKKLAKKKKMKKAIAAADCEDIIGDLPVRFHYRETEPVDFGLTAEELLMASDEEPDQRVKPNHEQKDRKKKHRRRGLNHKKFAKVGVAPDRLLAYGLSKTKLKKNKLL